MASGSNPKYAEVVGHVVDRQCSDALDDTDLIADQFVQLGESSALAEFGRACQQPPLCLGQNLARDTVLVRVPPAGG